MKKRILFTGLLLLLTLGTFAVTPVAPDYHRKRQSQRRNLRLYQKLFPENRS